MNRWITRVVVLTSVFAFMPYMQGQSNAFRIDRVISGVRLVGTAPDVSVEEVKTTFELPRDKEVIVYFEWTGTAGGHRFEAVWKNPSGQEAGRSGFTADSLSGKFSGSWKLFLSDKTPLGRWMIESWIDGQIVGTYQFDIRVGNSVAPVNGERPGVRLPGMAEIHRKANAATVFIEHLDKKDGGTVTGSGFFLSPNTVVTSFSVIDGAETLRLSSGPRSFALAGVVAWNRLQDWAILQTTESSPDFLTLADAKSGAVGERCLALSVLEQRDRSLIDGAIAGVLTKPVIGERLVLKMDPLSDDFDSMKDEAAGSPLMNMRGEVFALAIGPATVLPGSGWVRVVRSHNLFEADSPFAGLKVLGVSAKYWAPAIKGSTVTSLAQLAARKEFAVDLVNSNYVQSGTIALKADASGGPIGAAFGFHYSAKELQVFITWNAAEQFNGTGTIKVYDENNRLVIDTKPQKTKTPPAAKWVVSPGTIAIDQLSPGTYRVDYVLNDLPAWRSFFRIIPGR